MLACECPEIIVLEGLPHLEARGMVYYAGLHVFFQKRLRHQSPENDEHDHNQDRDHDLQNEFLRPHAQKCSKG